MKRIKLRSYFVKIKNTTYICPECGCMDDDSDSRLLRRMKPDRGCTMSKCKECGCKIYLTYSIFGNIETIKR